MEPRIIKGHRYLCKKTVQMATIKRDGKEKMTSEIAYIKGKVYCCDMDTPYPDDTWHWADKKNASGCIIDEQGCRHSWPYDPEHHPWCRDRWTDFFEDLGEQP